MVLNPYEYDDSEVVVVEEEVEPGYEPPPPPLPYYLLTKPLIEYDPHQSRDRTGKWASGGSAGTQVAVRSLERTGGYSVRHYGTATKKPPATGIMMGYGTSRGHNVKITSAEKMTHRDRVTAIKEHYKANRSFIHASSDRFDGGWMQTHADGTATLHLDVSRYFPPSQRASAIRFGKREDQIAGFDLATGDDVVIGGGG